MRRRSFALLVLGAALAASSCSLNETEAPVLSGPSEMALSLTLVATPDVLTQDGESESTIVVLARDANGQAIKGLPVRLDVTVGSIIVDYGRLSAKNLVTGADGRAAAYYVAPPPAVEAVDEGTVLTILATPVGTDYRGATARAVDIRLVPKGVVLPPNGTPTAAFSFSPLMPAAFTDVTFDASASKDDDGTIVSYTWDFGDGGSASGRTAEHQYRLAGSYLVTLTVTDDRNMKASASQTVSVMAATVPTAAFVFSPVSPTVNEEIFFNATTSKAAPGRYLVSYEWNFGGSTRTGMTVSKSYSVAGTYAVTLKVTDDAGQIGTASQTVTVSESGPGGPVAHFVYSPTTAKVGDRVTFDASSSKSPSGIVSWIWEWNDTTNGDSGQIVQHAFSTAGAYVVRLTVTDGKGNKATTTQSVTITGR